MTAEEIEKLIANIEVKLPTALHGLLKRSDGAASLLEQLPEVYTPLAVADENSPEHDVWDSIGYVYRLQDRYYEAIAIYRKLYDHMLAAQEEMHKRCHKGKPLCWICDCYRMLGYGLVFRRFLMLTLVEDAIRDKGSLKAEHSGVPLRAVVLAGFSHLELARYSQRCYEVFQSNESESFYPEWVLQQLDQDWVISSSSGGGVISK
jgi:hypothetical protein